MKRRETPPPTGQDDLILPKELTATSGTSTAAEFSSFLASQRAWLLEHGVDMSDPRRVLAVLRASKAHHGIPDAHERARLRSLALNATTDTRST